MRQAPTSAPSPFWRYLGLLFVSPEKQPIARFLGFSHGHSSAMRHGCSIARTTATCCAVVKLSCTPAAAIARHRHRRRGSGLAPWGTTTAGVSTTATGSSAERSDEACRSNRLRAAGLDAQLSCSKARLTGDDRRLRFRPLPATHIAFLPAIAAHCATSFTVGRSLTQTLADGLPARPRRRLRRLRSSSSRSLNGSKCARSRLLANAS